LVFVVCWRTNPVYFEFGTLSLSRTMGDDRYDWSIGTRARDFDIVVTELGGVYEAKPKIMVEKLSYMGHKVTYNQVKSRL